jgi:ATP/maltotriose-dependent transcriptional regulator MalT
LSIALTGQGHFASLSGDFEAATTLFAEYDAVHEATGVGWYSVGRLVLAAYQGRPDAFDSTAAAADAAAGQGEQSATWTRAVLYNALGRHAEALAAAELATGRDANPTRTAWALPEVIEASARCGEPEVARQAMERLRTHTLSDSDWAAGVAARSQALVTEGEEAERCHHEALELLERTPFQTELARAHLVYGEWLRGEHRKAEARQQLLAAHDMFTAIGAEAFAERSRRELLATGARVRERNPATQDGLTPQEANIARLAREGLSNPEIGSRLFLSPRTVEWHLSKIFGKLGISSRKELHDALPASAPESSVTV